ncbi:UNVERIFIED_CONTAM: hypothetical protein HDU68_009940 [Siphonaria sp. JEL0065]|nr:hypothetical protein HDU68_009937 [Siphonaria sp. JEL0065]KAJ3030166.1 hypothetical protein HDU68_009940 [Siphonaria sp. JEL0065]
MKGLAFVVTSNLASDFEAALGKVASLHAKHGPFDFALATGDFFAALAENDELLVRMQSGTIKVACPLYVVAGASGVPSAVAQAVAATGEVAPNVFLLEGGGGVFATSDGLQIAHVGLGADVTSLVKAARTVDVLLAGAVPLNVSLHSTVQINEAAADADVARVAAKVRPRYLFAPAAAYAEREPYKNRKEFGEKDSVSTRFVALAPFAPKSKQRWFYAFNIVPLKDLDAKTLYATPENATASPYALVPSAQPSTASAKAAKRPLPDRPEDIGQNSFFWNNPNASSNKSQKTNVPPSHYVCNICHIPGHWIQECPQKDAPLPPSPSSTHQQAIDFHPHHQHHPTDPNVVCHLCKQSGHLAVYCPIKQKKKIAGGGLDRDPSKCWFCLSSPNLEKHLIVDIKEECYIAGTKGSLSDWGGHLLIIPINHFGSRMEILDNAPLLSEITHCQELLIQKFGEKTGEVPVFFEVYPGHPGDNTVRRVQHMHIQVIPIAPTLIPILRSKFLAAAAASTLVAMPDGALPADPNMPYVRIELPDQPLGSEPLVFTMPINGPPKASFNQQFARRVLAEALGVPHRSSWKNCILTQPEEAALTQNVKKLLLE